MSENDSSQEKTEEPTSKRLDKAREDGTVPRSKELTTSALLILGTIALMVTGGQISSAIMGVMVACFGASREVIFDTQKLLGLFATAIYESFYSLIPFFLCRAICVYCWAYSFRWFFME